MFRSKGSRSMFTNHMSIIPRNILFPNAYFIASTTATTEEATSFLEITSVIDVNQYAILQKIHDEYTVLLSNKKYESISTNYDQYIFLLHELKEMNILDSTLKLLIQITEETLIGSVNMSSLYESSVYNEIQILLLNKKIDDILSNKNVKNTIMDGVTGQFSIKKNFKLSPIFSYYVYLYGLPEYGVGFDADKLSILQIVLGYIEDTTLTGHNISGSTIINTNNTSTVLGSIINNGKPIDIPVPIDIIENNVFIGVTDEYNADTTYTTDNNFVSDTISPISIENIVSRSTDCSMSQFNVSDAFEINFDVREFNTLLGLTKDASNIGIISSTYDVSTNSFANDSITLPFTNFFSGINHNTQLSVGNLSNLASDFQSYINLRYGTINLSSLYNISGDFNPFNGVFDNSGFVTLISSLESSMDSSGFVSKSIHGVMVSGLSGNITINNINCLLDFAVRSNASGNRIPDSSTYSSYNVRNGFLADDLIYIPNGLNILLNVYFQYLTGEILIISSKTYTIPLLIRLSNLS